MLDIPTDDSVELNGRIRVLEEEERKEESSAIILTAKEVLLTIPAIIDVVALQRSEGSSGVHKLLHSQHMSNIECWTLLGYRCR